MRDGAEIGGIEGWLDESAGVVGEGQRGGPGERCQVVILKKTVVGADVESEENENDREACESEAQLPGERDSLILRWRGTS